MDRQTPIISIYPLHGSPVVCRQVTVEPQPGGPPTHMVQATSISCEVLYEAATWAIISLIKLM